MLSNRQWHHHLSTKVPTEGQYVCVCVLTCVSEGHLAAGYKHTHTHTPSLSRCFSSLVSSPLCLALLLEVLIRRHSANITTSHIKLGWVRRMIAIFVCPCVGGLSLVLCKLEEHIFLCVRDMPGHRAAGLSSASGEDGVIFPPPHTHTWERRCRRRCAFLHPPFSSMFHPPPPPSLIPDSLSSSLCH